MTDQELQSRAIAVTFFEDRARVVRHAKISDLAPGRHTVRVDGVSMLVDDTSLIVRCGADGARVLTSRVHRQLRSRTTADPDAIRALQSRADEARYLLEHRLREVNRRFREQGRVIALEDAFVDAISDLPRGEKSDSDTWRAALSEVDAAFAAAEDAFVTAMDALQDAEREGARAELLLTQARAEHPELVAFVEVELEVTEDVASSGLELEYFVPCALWRPSHVARLNADQTELSLRMMATVWQCTGEQWNGVRCRFSTARPTRAAEAPLIDDDWLRSRPKTPEERRVVDVEARDVDISTTGSEVGGNVDQMPGVDDGGEPLTLDAADAVSIPSTGEPFRVEIGVFDAACRTDVVAMAERSTVPYLRARGTWEHEIPVLAGPLVVMRGNEYAGRSHIDFTSSGEDFEVGFGVDTGISVHRTVDDEHKTTAVMGKNLLQRTIKVFISNLSAQRRHLTIVERVPVSEIEEVSIKSVTAESKPDQDGFVEFGVTLEPRAVSSHTISYRVEYGSKVRVSW